MLYFIYKELTKMAEERKSNIPEDLDTIVMVDEKGNKKNLTIYFTYHSDKFDRDYVIFYDPDNEEELISAWVDEGGDLHDLETEDEFNELSSVVDEYQEDNKD
jgi:uncharacterized protein YrzB (UPF0473 family)